MLVWIGWMFGLDWIGVAAMDWSWERIWNEAEHLLLEDEIFKVKYFYSGNFSNYVSHLLGFSSTRHLLCDTKFHDFFNTNCRSPQYYQYEWEVRMRTLPQYYQKAIYFRRGHLKSQIVYSKIFFKQKLFQQWIQIFYLHTNAMQTETVPANISMQLHSKSPSVNSPNFSSSHASMVSVRRENKFNGSSTQVRMNAIGCHASSEFQNGVVVM